MGEVMMMESEKHYVGNRTACDTDCKAESAVTVVEGSGKQQIQQTNSTWLRMTPD